MKRTKLYSTVILLLAVALFTAGNSFGMSKDGDEIKPNEKEAKILIAGISSPNLGISRACIYYSGKYKVAQSVNTLVDILEDSSRDNYTRTLAAFALSRIGDPEGLQAIKEVTVDDKDSKLKIVCEMLFKELYDLNELPLSAKN